jgi:hypothetical protein
LQNAQQRFETIFQTIQAAFAIVEVKQSRRASRGARLVLCQ